MSNIYTGTEIFGALGNLTLATNLSSLDISTEALQQSFMDIAAEISRLNKVSNTIRRASKEDQILKAIGFHIRDDGGNDVEPALIGHFEHHIRDRFANTSDTIRQRLARAMLLQRKRILYRRYRQGNMTDQPQEMVSKTPVTLPTALSAQVNSPQDTDENQIDTSPSNVIEPSHIASATTLAPEKFKMAASTPSVVSTSKTIALGKHEPLYFPPAPGYAARQKYER